DRQLDDQGRLTQRLDHKPVTVSYRAEPHEMLWLQVDLGATPEGRAAPYFLLRVGFDCWCLNRMTIGLERDGRKAWGYTCVPVSVLSLERLDAVLQELLEVAVPIRARIIANDFSIGGETFEAADRSPSAVAPGGMTRV
ncbi:MAG: type III secretion system chaperone, partial [Pseudomonadota bacterium]